MPKQVRIPDELAERIDQARGDVPRERWVTRTLERELAQRTVPAAQEPDTEPQRPPAPARASREACPECGRFNGVHKKECTLR